MAASAQVRIPGPGGSSPASGPTHTFSFTASANTHCDAVQGSDSTNCTLGAAPVSGKLIIVGGLTQGASGTPTVCDVATVGCGGATCTATVTSSNNKSNTNDATAGTAWLFFLSATGTCGTTWTIRATSSGVTGIYVSVVSVSGASAVTQDGSDAIGNVTSGTSIATPTVPGPTSGDLQVCYVVNEIATTAVNSPWGTGGGIGGAGDAMEFILSSSGAQACNFTQTSGHADVIGAPFK